LSEVQIKTSCDDLYKSTLANSAGKKIFNFCQGGQCCSIAGFSGQKLCEEDKILNYHLQLDDCTHLSPTLQRISDLFTPIIP
jgi:hypothetical protein